jgi:hypothetical protein
MSQMINGNADPLSGTNTEMFQKIKFGGGLSQIVPTDLLFVAPKLGVPLSRMPVKRRAEQTNYTSLGNNEIIIQFPNDSIYDARRGYITFDLAISVTGGTYKRIAEGIWSIFYRMRTILGFELENVFEYNRMYSIFWDAINDARQSSAVARKIMGIGTPTERNIMGATTTHYMMPLLSGFFDQDVLPLNFINNIVQLYLNLGDAATYVETDGTNPQINVSNVLFHFERIVAGNDYVDRIRSTMATSGLKLGFDTYNYYTQILPTGAQSTNTITINHKSASIKHFISVFTKAAEVSNPAINDKFRTWLKKTDQWQLRLNEKLFPEERVRYDDPYSIEQFLIYLNWLNKWNFSGKLNFEPPPITVEEYSADKFLIIVDVNGYPYDKDVINPVGNDAVATQMQLDINIPVALTEVNRFDTFVCYFRQFVILSDGTARVTF